MRAGLRSVLCTGLWLLVSFDGVKAMEMVAHRGASYDAPENTLTAMKLAWQQGADAIELDLWLSKDGKLVVMHDGDTKRMGGSEIALSNQTWTALQQVDVGAWKALNFAGERIPTLESILATVPHGKRAVLELKAGPEIVPELARVLSGSGRKSNEIAIISFHFETLNASKEEFPAIEHYWLHGYAKDKKTGQYPVLEPLIERAKAAGFEGLDLNYHWPINREFVDRVNKAGLKLLVWTVNDPAVAKRLQEAGVESITTDRPQWLRKQIQ